jgi:uncharacterized membrane protein YedE/YeeE
MSRERLAEIGVSLAVGLVFGLGLIVSGMADPAKVLGFLDLFGNWDPSLALVMASAVGIGLLGFGLDPARTRSALGLPMRLPAKGSIDARLVAGSLAFGAGWGIAGFCPGPALVALGMGSRGALWFVAAMVAGMALHRLTSAPRP